MRRHYILCASKGETKQKEIRYYSEFSTLVLLKSVVSDYISTSLQFLCLPIETYSPDRDRKHSSLKSILDSLRETNTVSGALKHTTQKYLEVVLSFMFPCIVPYNTVLPNVSKYLPARNKSFLLSCLAVSAEIIYTIIYLENILSC